MTPPNARAAGALAVASLMAALAMAAVRLQPRAAAFDPLEGAPAQVPCWRVDLDSAEAAEIEALPGVGPRLAQRIVQHRAAHGPFGGVKGLERVSGVGPALVERIAPFVR